MRKHYPGLVSYDDVVAHYRCNFAVAAREQMGFFADARQSLQEAIVRACASMIPRKNGIGLKRHGHQSRRAVTDDALSDAAERLYARRARITRVRKFDVLFDLVEATIGDIYGVGELALYDITSRIGAYRGLRPSRVYLHRGTREGAKALGLGLRSRCIPLESLPGALRTLAGWEAEDVLCIYRVALARIRAGLEGSAPRKACSDREAVSLSRGCV